MSQYIIDQAIQAADQGLIPDQAVQDLANDDLTASNALWIMDAIADDDSFYPLYNYLSVNFDD